MTSQKGPISAQGFFFISFFLTFSLCSAKRRMTTSKMDIPIELFPLRLHRPIQSVNPDFSLFLFFSFPFFSFFFVGGPVVLFCAGLTRQQLRLLELDVVGLTLKPSVASTSTLGNGAISLRVLLLLLYILFFPVKFRLIFISIFPSFCPTIVSRLSLPFHLLPTTTSFPTAELDQ